MSAVGQLKIAYLDSLGISDVEDVLIKKITFREKEYIVVDHLVLIEVKEIDETIKGCQNIDLKLNNVIMGELIISDIDKNPLNTSTLTSSEIIYCIAKAFMGNNIESVKFDTHYVLLNEEFFLRYILDFYETSSFWGRYSHSSRNHIFQPAMSEINLPDEAIRFPTKFHRDTSINNLFSISPFDKFLKSYHQIELLFNLVIVKNIQNIDISNIFEINNIYKDLKKSEIESIIYIFEKYLDYDERYLKIMVKGFISNEVLCEEFLQKYSKESNPLSDSVRWNKFVNFLKKADQDACQSIDEFFNTACHSSVEFFKTSQKNDFLKTIRKINAYWIYRIRCSIAHNKLGEFIFEAKPDHYEFIYHYGEPLLKQTISCVFSNKDFKELFSE